MTSKEKIISPTRYIKKLQEAGLEKHANVYAKILDIAKTIKEANGHALLVGGVVRDKILEKVSKDFDLEVYGLELGKVEEIVSRFGKVSNVGKAFGVLKAFLADGIDIDISLPRADSKVDVGHTGFEIRTNPYMSISEAASRRDFTINSIMEDPLTGRIYDPFDGVEDTKNHILRVTDSEKFSEDPLRVMRALQFVGRFDMTVDVESVRVIRKTASYLKELPKERIFEEWKKLLLKSEKPSVGLQAGMILGIFEEMHRNEFLPMIETPQDPEWHPEGNVWIHTLLTIDEGAKIIRSENLNDNEALTVLLGSLCHDLGKPSTTEFKNGHYISHGHEKAAEEPTRNFLTTIGAGNAIRDKVIKLVNNHLAPTLLYKDEVGRGKKVSDGAIRRLARRIHPATIYELVLVTQADHFGRGLFINSGAEKQKLPARKWLLERARILDVEKKKPENLIKGKDLIGLGYEPGTDFGKIINIANTLRDERNFTKELVFQALNNIKCGKEAIMKLNNLLEVN